MTSIRLLNVIAAIGLLAACGAMETATKPDSAAAAAATSKSLYAVEIKVGPNWNNSKPPNEQAFFAEHATNLRSLREAGHIVMGARYSDIGLIIFTADSADQVTALMSQDASMAAGTFRFEVHPLNVFYPGLVQRGPAN